MLVKVRRGSFNPHGGDLEPIGDEIWSGGADDLSAAALTTEHDRLELGTWYQLGDFEALLPGPEQGDGEVQSAIVVEQPGVVRSWHATIAIGEIQAALMVCRSVVDFARRYSDGPDLWVRVE